MFYLTIRTHRHIRHSRLSIHASTTICRLNFALHFTEEYYFNHGRKRRVDVSLTERIDRF